MKDLKIKKIWFVSVLAFIILGLLFKINLNSSFGAAESIMVSLIVIVPMFFGFLVVSYINLVPLYKGFIQFLLFLPIFILVAFNLYFAFSLLYFSLDIFINVHLLALSVGCTLMLFSVELSLVFSQIKLFEKKDLSCQ